MEERQWGVCEVFCLVFGLGVFQIRGDFKYINRDVYFSIKLVIILL